MSNKGIPKVGLNFDDDSKELQPSCMRGLKMAKDDPRVVFADYLNPVDQEWKAGMRAMHRGVSVLVLCWHPHHPVIVVESNEGNIYTVIHSDLKPIS